MQKYGVKTLENLRSIVLFLLFGNIFISVCAVLMCYFTEMIFTSSHNYQLLCFVFFATLCSYNLHSYFNPDTSSKSVRLSWIQKHRLLLIISFLLAVLGMIIIFFSISYSYRWILPLSVLSLLYSLPRVLKSTGSFLKPIIYFKTIYLAVIWSVVTVLLPLVLDNYACDYQSTVFLFNRFFIILQVSILFEYRERKLEIPGKPGNLISILNENKFNLLFYFLSLLFMVSAGLLFVGKPDYSLLFSILIPEILLYLTYKRSKSMCSDYWYYVFIDGILMLSTLIFILFANRI